MEDHQCHGREQQHPQQPVAVVGAEDRVGGDAGGIVVGQARQKSRPQHREDSNGPGSRAGTAPRWGRVGDPRRGGHRRDPGGRERRSHVRGVVDPPARGSPQPATRDRRARRRRGRVVGGPPGEGGGCSTASETLGAGSCRTTSAADAIGRCVSRWARSAPSSPWTDEDGVASWTRCPFRDVRWTWDRDRSRAGGTRSLPQAETPEEDPCPDLQPGDDKRTVGSQLEPHISHPRRPPTRYVVHPGVEDVAHEHQLVRGHVDRRPGGLRISNVPRWRTRVRSGQGTDHLSRRLPTTTSGRWDRCGGEVDHDIVQPADPSRVVPPVDRPTGQRGQAQPARSHRAARVAGGDDEHRTLAGSHQGAGGGAERGREPRMVVAMAPDHHQVAGLGDLVEGHDRTVVPAAPRRP